MGKPKRTLLATAEETLKPPGTLEKGHVIAKIVNGEGNNLWSVQLPNQSEPSLVELPSRFRSTIWLKRGGYVVVDTTAFGGRENKLEGEVANVVMNEKIWRKQAYWYVLAVADIALSSSARRPKEFQKTTAYPRDSDEMESNVGRMPSPEDSDLSN
ncbi:uncharacterized protein KY384_007738 [Bacidia gigantensis]|uniref:uncharacterized protein n=1 Tax=Bacidia gigantensis TaxID=2732470 RepID=UPI001D03E776|nr:uncharacterized protein KY384_007738 [Bacidia gigantensis]KAG8527585.1 hypothetical protein KY384_007738 [Bacidia gigantensis]